MTQWTKEAKTHIYKLGQKIKERLANKIMSEAREIRVNLLR